MERIQKLISQSGLCSRRKAEELILSGRVSVKGQVVKELGAKADNISDISVDGKPLKGEEKVVFMLHKPKNVISSVSDDRGRLTVIDFVNEPYRLYPLGRLDYDTSGLLLLSNDGELTQHLLHPSFEVVKTYEATINKLITKEEILKLEQGVRIDNYISAPAQIKLLNQNPNKKTSFLEVNIHEGHNREVRKMFATIGAEVIKLKRTKEAGLELGNLRAGEYRRLKPVELVRLKRYLGIR